MPRLDSLAEPYEDIPLVDHRDSYLYMKMRRLINGQYAEQPMDFNEEGLKVAQKLAGYAMDELIIADIGSSSGEMVAEALGKTGIDATVICIDPDKEAAEAFYRLPEERKERLHFVKSAGEDTPLPDSSVQGATLHNVIFRANNAEAMLNEAKRIVEPDGFIAVSSNARGHAHWRHHFESTVAELIMEMTGESFAAPAPPAEGHYLEDLPELFNKVGGLEVRDDLYMEQNTEAVITRGDRLFTYLNSIKFSAANTGLPSKYRIIWRQVVDTFIRNTIDRRIDEAEGLYDDLKIHREPYFADPIRRGMYVLINKKSD
jgi:ubiquinone/menaquinone biosynthesis C-methylase UbiE